MKVAVVGCGRIGATHAAAVRGLGAGAPLVFSDPDLDAARRTAASFGGGAAYRDHGRLPRGRTPRRGPRLHASRHARRAGDPGAVGGRRGAGREAARPLAHGDSAGRCRAAPAAGSALRRPQLPLRALHADGARLGEHRPHRSRAGCRHLLRRRIASGRYAARPLGQDAAGRPFHGRSPHAIYLARHFVGDVERVAACDARDPWAGRTWASPSPARAASLPCVSRSPPRRGSSASCCAARRARSAWISRASGPCWPRSRPAPAGG